VGYNTAPQNQKMDGEPRGPASTAAREITSERDKRKRAEGVPVVRRRKKHDIKGWDQRFIVKSGGRTPKRTSPVNKESKRRKKGL